MQKANTNTTYERLKVTKNDRCLDSSSLTFCSDLPDAQLADEVPNKSWVWNPKVITDPMEISAQVNVGFDLAIDNQAQNEQA